MYEETGIVSFHLETFRVQNLQKQKENIHVIHLHYEFELV